MKIARRVLYSGRVQGVGFRATTRRVASGFDVAGTVRNLADGRVEVVVEGEEGEVRGFLDAIRGRMSGNVTDASESATYPTGAVAFDVVH